MHEVLIRRNGHTAALAIMYSQVTGGRIEDEGQGGWFGKFFSRGQGKEQGKG